MSATLYMEFVVDNFTWDSSSRRPEVISEQVRDEARLTALGPAPGILEQPCRQR